MDFAQKPVVEEKKLIRGWLLRKKNMFLVSSRLLRKKKFWSVAGYCGAMDLVSSWLLRKKEVWSVAGC